MYLFYSILWKNILIVRVVKKSSLANDYPRHVMFTTFCVCTRVSIAMVNEHETIYKIKIKSEFSTTLHLSFLKKFHILPIDIIEPLLS
jgi:hypothetical protein